MNDQEKHEWIEQYLNGQLQEEALKQFEAWLKTKPTFAKEVKLFQENRNVFSDQAMWTLHEELKLFKKKNRGNIPINPNIIPSQKRILVKKRRWAVAAAILLLFISFTIIYQTYLASPSSSQELYANEIDFPSLKDLTGEDIFRTIEPSSSSDFSILQKDLQVQYKNKEYRKALTSLEGLLNFDITQKERFGLLYAKGILHLALNQPQEMFRTFETVEGYTEGKSWYTAMAFLQVGNVQEAKSAFQEAIKWQNGQRKQQGIEILTKLEQLE